MFLQHFKLREQPFGMTPNPRFLWSSPSHREAFASLVYGIETGRGFVALIAKPGMGKTTLLFQLMERLQSSARTVFLFQSQGNSREFFSNLIADLGLDPSENDLGKLQRQLNDILIEESRMGRRFVLIVDEAQNLADSVLESVRMLSNFETPQAKLMQIVLSGQPQLADKLMRPELAQLRQRISVIANLNPLSELEVGHYIQYRLSAAGYQGQPLFAPEAVEIIADRSEGIPRNINNICFHALSVCFARAQRTIDLSIIEEVLADLNLARLRSRRPEAPRRITGVGAIRSRTSPPARPAKTTFDPGSVALHGNRPGISWAPRALRARGGGRLFWAAAFATLLIWAGVFWDSSTARFQLDTIDLAIAQTIHKAKVIAQNVKAGVSQPQPESALQRANESGAPNPQNALTPEQSSTQPQTQDLPQATDSGVTNDAQVSPAEPTGTPSESGPESEPSSKTTETSREGAQKPSRQRSSGRSALDSSAHNGTIVVESDVRGGRITVNGRHEDDWVTPHILSLPPGAYRVEVSKGGYARWSQLVHVGEATRRWVMANLGLPSGLLVLQTEPPGMEVFIDGRYYGSSTVKITLAAGEHIYKVVSQSGSELYSGTIEIQPGRILMKTVRWQEASNLGKGGDASGGNERGLAARRKAS